MRIPLILSGAVGLASARIYPYMYGVPKSPEPDVAQIEKIPAGKAVGNNTSALSTQHPVPTPAPAAPATPGLAEPCAIVSSALAALPSGARKVVPAELGLMCLQSVPLDKEGNIKLIDELKFFLQWQSNLVYLKNPPADYTEDPVDIIGEMESMQKQLSSGGYENEYDFQLDLMTLFNRAYDNHLAWQPDIIAGVMQFQRPAGTELASVSSDGVALPEIFAYRDLQLAQTNSSFKPSPLRTINGQGTESFLQTVAPQADFHDADSRWNALFPSQPLLATGSGFLGSFRTGRYMGANTTMAFENGTTLSVVNMAVVFANFTAVDSGRAFFSKFCTGPQPTTTTAASTATVTSSATSTSVVMPSHTGYPKAVLLHPNLSLGGYWLNNSGYEDLAVLSIPSYESPNVQLFQNIMRDFIRMSVAAKKTKLVIDLRSNGGGNAILGYDTFKQVFPQREQEPFGASRYRANVALNITGQITSDFADGKTYVQNNETAFIENFNGTTANDIMLFTAPFNFHHQLDINNEDLSSWPEMFGPVQQNGDLFTSTIRYNFSDEPSYTYPGFSVIGFLNNTNETNTPQPFEAENMVMLHDGMCSSTCAIVSELLKNQGAVRTVVIGGQPKFGPMQGIGGTKGSQNFQWDDISVRSQIAFFLGSPEQQAAWNGTDFGKTAFATQLFKRSAYAGGSAAGGINFRDNLRKGDESQTPLQFIYEAADCRMWFTAPMINDVTEVWKGVADRMWKNTTCVQGSVSAGGQDKGGSLPPPPLQKGPKSMAHGRARSRGVLGLTLITWAGTLVVLF
ncbi:hypothetical protein BCR34DRAFT_365903 [Clohesyomyces aquaticus]|uniref:Uncharacterized protein n=1 Tax=Clohesyomyces aquaticus TaxID=1231657 RepID=A0A1Y1ZIU6_9PLEO|nr:hypothetical protein BCR34DRAFT_365903 [Clohesyomyces aquaticus]